jgi:hypothetical protein
MQSRLTWAAARTTLCLPWQRQQQSQEQQQQQQQHRLMRTAALCRQCSA